MKKYIKNWAVVARVEGFERDGFRVALKCDTKEEAENILEAVASTGFFTKEEHNIFGTIYKDSMGQFFYIVEGYKKS